MSLVVPAVLPASHKDLEEKLALLAPLPSVSRVQIDVVDGLLAKPASWPYVSPKEFQASASRGEFISQEEMLPYLDRIEYEIDLMCVAVEEAVAGWVTLGASRFTIHIERIRDPAAFFASLRKRYISTLISGPRMVSIGVALNVTTDSARIESLLENVDYVQVMGIAEIGRQGQPFDPRALVKVKEFHTRHPQIPIQIDGGVSITNAREMIRAGVSNLIVGSAIWRAADPAAAIAAIEALQTPYGV